MYAYLKGVFALKTPTSVVVDVGGVGYHVEISLNTFGRIEHQEQGLLWTQLIVREDAQVLYGFAERDEREIFNHLISVSGIGPNTARLILSSMLPVDVQSAIIHEDELSFKRVKGVGPKTAKRLIIDLKDKMSRSGAEISIGNPLEESNSSRREALSALIALGFQAGPVQKVMNKVSSGLDDDADTEDWIKAALKELSK